MARKVKCCGDCGYFDSCYEEYEPILGREISKGTCEICSDRYASINQPIFETSVPCEHAVHYKELFPDWP